MVRLACAATVALTSALVSTAPVRADSAADSAAITRRLLRWTAAFNAKNSAEICDLFAPDLVYSIPQVRHGTREKLCQNLDKMLARPDLQLHYDNPDVHEIIVAGDLAVVRLTWTLTTKSMGGAKDTTTEEGIDIFRRQPDGQWSIARFNAFTTQMNKLLR
jgi:steroid delta-isomerase